MGGELADALIARIDKLIADRLDAAITSRLAATSYIAPNNNGITAIQSKTDAYLDAAISDDATRVWAAASRTLTSAPSIIASIQTGYLHYANGTTGSGEDLFYRDVTINSVNMNKAVVLLVGTPQISDTHFSAHLTSSTNLRVGTNNNGEISGRWTVVEFA